MTRILSQDDLKNLDAMFSQEQFPGQNWETDPESWKNPEDCPWGDLVENFNQEFDQVPTMVHQVLFQNPQLNETFEDMLINNVMFKKGTGSQDFPSKFTHEEFAVASDAQKMQTLKAMDKISQEVVEFLQMEGLPITTDGSPIPDLRLYKAPAVKQ